MNLPLITAKIGRDFKSNDIFESMYKEAKLNPKKEYNDVFLTFDLEKERIEFEQPIPHQKGHSKAFKYFGNNAARASQIHLVRETGSLRYLLFKIWNDLYKNIKDGDYDELEAIFKMLFYAELLLIEDDHCKINVQKFSMPVENAESLLEDNKKVILLNAEGVEIYNDFPSKFIKDCLNFGGKEEISLVIPRVRNNDGEEIILSKCSDYLKLIKKVNKLGTQSNSKQQGQSKKRKICYICEQNKSNTSVDYTKKLSRTGINKIFITENVNATYDFEKSSQDLSYAMCNQCFNDLKYGEKKIQEEYEIRLAGENTIVLPEGYLDDFDYVEFPKLKKEIDTIFYPKDLENFSAHVEEEADIIEQKNYTINFIVYRTDGNSVTILQTIEDINNRNFSKIIKTFKKNNDRLEKCFGNYSLKFGLHSVYRIIPVKTSKDRTQQNIKRVLSLYSAIFKLEKIKTKVLFEYAAESIEKGISQLKSSEIRNYRNLVSHKDNVDYFLKRITTGYLALIQSLQDLQITDKVIFNHTERGETMAENQTTYLTDETEKFLTENGFSKESKSLFYLGCLLGKIGYAQYNKGHKTKPILNKITFQGMNKKDLVNLYNDLIEKYRQYIKIIYSPEFEQLMQKFHENFGTAEKSWPLSDHENIFYLMSGYSFLVGKKSNTDDQSDNDSEEKGE